LFFDMTAKKAHIFGRELPKMHSSGVRATDPPLRILSPPMADIEAHITGNVWKIEVSVGDEIEDGDTVVILESMKM